VPVVQAAVSTPLAAMLRSRDWFLGIDHHHVFDRAGNIGPTLWLDGEYLRDPHPRRTLPRPGQH
jgi:hypothetical protein